MARNCPYPKQRTDEQEVRGERRVGHVTSQDIQKDASTSNQREISELRKKLQQAKLAEAIQTASYTGVLSVVQSGDESLEPRFGPIVFAPVEVNGVATDALVDTGSPATIISLGFVLKVLTKLRPKGQTDQQWREDTQKKFKDPDVALNSYGGHQLDFMARIELSLSQGGRQIETVVLVKKDAPNDLLIGTDVQSRFGFSLLMKKSDGSIADLLSGEVTLPQPQSTAKQNQGELAVSSPTEKMAKHGGETQQGEHEVRLLQAIKIPAGHQKLVRGRIPTDTDGGPPLFTPGELEETLQMADGVMEMGDDCFITLIVQNHGTEKLHLKTGVRLGTVVAPVDVLAAGGRGDNVRLGGSGEAVVTVAHKGEMAAVVNRTGDRDAATPRVRELANGPVSVDQSVVAEEEGNTTELVSVPRVSMQPTPVDKDMSSSAQMQWLQESSKQDRRVVDLFSQIEMNLSHLTEEEQQSLKSLLASYSDVFALDQSELGTTQLVTHSIDTGTHPPIKQQVRRTPEEESGPVSAGDVGPEGDRAI